MSSAQFAVGIDLGTTNSVLAYRSLSEENAVVEVLPIPQLTAASTIESRDVLPSFMYIGTAEEAAAGVANLPWSRERDFAVGSWARAQASESPMRTIAAAKSWLGHSKVDRHAQILPWGAPDEVIKRSPVEASSAYLAHLVAAWNQAHPDAPFNEQEIVLTVPASFDASARELTQAAAKAAGFPEEFIMLEEPQAAVYAWLAEQGEHWRKSLSKDDTLLVCDVGGGTSDFTLVRVEEQEGDLVLRRVAVGNHVLVGGDNMDLLMAHLASAAFAEKGIEVDAWQSVALWHACRKAKEQLLNADGPETHPVSVLGRGRSVIGGAINVDLNRAEITQHLLDGFFPECERDARPQRQRTAGFKELGLPFESDTGITRHLAEFLSVQSESGEAIRPTHVLFNGGTFKAAPFRERMLSLFGTWFEGRVPEVLHGYKDLDYAVARGAAYYASAKVGGGIRICGGTARSYYIGIETAGLAIPGAPRPLHAFCVVQQGMEEGTACEVPGDSFGLVTGEPAHFRIFTSSSRKQDVPGDLLRRWNVGELEETDSMEAVLPAGEDEEDGFVPVRFESRITELGIFELWCTSTLTDQRWKFEFGAREEG